MTIRNITPQLSQALEEEKRRRGLSLNHTVLDLLRQSLGLGDGAPRSNGLAEQAGSWSAEDFEEFVRATEEFGEIDEEMWR